MELSGHSLIAGTRANGAGTAFRAVNPATGQTIEPDFFPATAKDVDAAAEAAQAALATYGRLSGGERAKFLRTIADGLDAASAELVARAQLETALPQPRLQGEVARTSNQLRLFAGLIEEGSWVNARIDTALPERKPLPRPDLRSMLRPLGPVAVFGASNFPLAFSVAGGDTASALAGGNPVIVKAHPAHPGTSELAAQVIAEAARACGLPGGVFSLLLDAGIEVGKALVQHPEVKAAGFTGSHTAGRALMDLAAQRHEPIPCFTEMSSTNPVFILPGALRERGAQIATGLHGSFTLGAGQFCTKPGMVFLPKQEGQDAFLAELRKLTAGSQAFTLLTPGIAASYRRALEKRLADARLQTSTGTEAANSCQATAALLETEIDTFLADPSLSDEIFGPDTLIVHYGEREAMLRAAAQLQGHLTATLLGTPEDLAAYQDLIAILERKVGRILFNGFPTGVEVSHAMVHGGPYPATSDSRFTSVGSQAILRFARPVCWQGFPQASLPAELQNENPLGILRMIDGDLTRSAVAVPVAG
ncbi:aldehyde dehydrogenase (NADP(+)) [Paracidobacterium acidisoli]|uniref:2,5-dioxovalerate dehydrogenase n=1 Tax=Paracidobacterium acidisoli TaxID=2303751 RepID=A0A372IJC8_9BACT|nr:aldehyde dehydrogenase (NADP(+)) [Paracidobacterium acidisoli]MBT9333254.1 aldehyde dehydrogenase (NADP(+)) [Paracidobacterium acidisoli]